MENKNVINILDKLISCKSVTPFDDKCQEYIASFLRDLGFKIEFKKYDDVTNLIARLGTEKPVVAYVGHTDVVPTGDVEKWDTDPFKLTDKNSKLYGRGTSDMKGGIACMMHSIQNFLSNKRKTIGSIVVILTSDEEGPAVDGTVRVVETLSERGDVIDWCLVGEPTSSKRLGDVIKNGRRGSLGGTLKVRGIQGHVAYPHLADNPIHRLSRIASELSSTRWDDGNEYFPATTFQVSNIRGGTGATNVVPGEAEAQFNLRFCPDSTGPDLKEKIESICRQHADHFEIDWSPLGLPYQTLPGTLVSAVTESICDATGYSPRLSSDGGTSDGRFIAPTGAQVVELGPLNRTIHQVDEVVNAEDLDTLSHVYEKVLRRLLDCMQNS